MILLVDKFSIHHPPGERIPSEYSVKKNAIECRASFSKRNCCLPCKIHIFPPGKRGNESHFRTHADCRLFTQSKSAREINKSERGRMRQMQKIHWIQTLRFLWTPLLSTPGAESCFSVPGSFPDTTAILPPAKIKVLLVAKRIPESLFYTSSPNAFVFCSRVSDHPFLNSFITFYSDILNTHSYAIHFSVSNDRRKAPPEHGQICFPIHRAVSKGG